MNTFETYLSNHPTEPEANKDTIIRGMTFYVEAVEYERDAIEAEKMAVETEKAASYAVVIEKTNLLAVIREMLKVETDAEIIKEVERLKALEK